MSHLSFDSDQTGMLYEAFRKGLHKDMEEDFAALNYFKKSKRKPEGYKIKGSIGLRHNPSGAPVDLDGAPIPERGRRKATEAEFTAGYHSVGVGITDEMIKYAENSKAKYFDLVKEQFEDASYTLNKMCSLAVRGWGAGVVATFDGAPSGSTTDVSLHGARYIVEGKRYGVYDVSEEAIIQYLTVDVVNTDGTVDFTAACDSDIADGDYLVYDNVTAATVAAGTADVMGFQGLADDGTLLSSFGGLTVATYGRFWQGNLDSSDSRAVSADPIFDMADKIDKRSGKPARRMLASKEFVSQLARKYISDVRFSKSDMNSKIGPGWKSLYIQAGSDPIEVIADRDQSGPEGYIGTVFMWSEEAPEYLEFWKPEWRSEDLSGSGGPVLHRSDTNYEYLGELTYGWQMATFRRTGLGVVKTFAVTDVAKA